MKIIQKKKQACGVELGKRFYMPGVTIEDKCPECGAKWSIDLGNNYLEQYQCTEDVTPVNAYCLAEACQHEWVAGEVVFHVTIEKVA